MVKDNYRVGHLTFGIWIGYKKNTWIFFQKYGFIRKIKPFHLGMKHNIVQMTATAGLTVPHSIKAIFQYILDCLGFNPMNGNFDFVFQASIVFGWLAYHLSLTALHKKQSKGVKSQLRDGQLTSEFRLIIRFSRTVRKRSNVTLAVWQVAPSCWNQMSSISSSSIFGNKNSLSMAR